VVPNHVAKLPVQFDFEKKESSNGNKYPVRHQVSFGSIFCTGRNQLVSGKNLQKKGKVSSIDVEYLFLSKDLWREKKHENFEILKSRNVKQVDQPLQRSRWSHPWHRTCLETSQLSKKKTV